MSKYCLKNVIELCSWAHGAWSLRLGALVQCDCHCQNKYRFSSGYSYAGIAVSSVTLARCNCLEANSKHVWMNAVTLSCVMLLPYWALVMKSKFFASFSYEIEHVWNTF